MNAAMLIAAAFVLLATAAFCAALYYQDVAANLEYDRDHTRDALADTSALLDDATRNAAYWQARTAALLCENNTLAVDLYHTETRMTYLENLHSQRKGTAAGIALLRGTVQQERKLHMHGDIP